MPLMTEEASTICNLCPLDTNSPYLDWEKHFFNVSVFGFVFCFFWGGRGGGLHYLIFMRRMNLH